MQATSSSALGAVLQLVHSTGAILHTSSSLCGLQVVLIANAIVYLALSFVTVPLYSLGVQMGSDFRPHIFSPDVKDRLLQIASANKEKVSTHIMLTHLSQLLLQSNL